MAEYKKGDLVKAAKKIDVPGGVISKGTPGSVTADTKRRIATVRVKFQRDATVRFRVVPKTTIKKR